MTGELIHLGFVVADLDAAILSYARLGVDLGPRVERRYRAVLRGVEGPVETVNVFAHWNDVPVEIAQPCAGESIHMEWLRSRGEGLFHVAVAADDPGQYGAAETVFDVPDNGVRFIDTRPDLGYYLELVPSSLVPAVRALHRRDGE